MENGAAAAGIPEEANRPAAVVQWEQMRDEAQAALSAQYGLGDIPDHVQDAAIEQQQNALFLVIDGLTRDEVDAETTYHNAAMRAKVRMAGSDAGLWDGAIKFWAAKRGAERGTLDRSAAAHAEQVLQRCTYLGGLPEYPNHAETFGLGCIVGDHGFLSFGLRGDGAAAHIPWPDILEMRVGATDRGQERVTATRVALFGVFALGAKKQRREAMLGVRTPNGEAIFIVDGHTPLELQAKLAPLIALVGRPTSDHLYALAANTGIDKALVAQEEEEMMMRLRTQIAGAAGAGSNAGAAPTT